MWFAVNKNNIKKIKEMERHKDLFGFDIGLRSRAFRDINSLYRIDFKISYVHFSNAVIQKNRGKSI